LIGRTLLHYRITAALGSGGMGTVYRATDTALGRDVALKVLPPEVAQDPERLARFRREAQLLAALNHPNIAAIHRLEEADGQLFLALELVEGEDLKDRIARGPLTVEEALEIAMQIADALEEAHEKGIVHRDLKPANVKLTPDGKVKVLDFGLAKAYAGEGVSASSPDLSQSPTLAATGTQAGVILGTAAYMSPEQARGKPVDKRADIWAFGAVLWEMLTGRPLFAGETVSDLLAGVLAREPEWAQLSEGARGVRVLLERCLEKDPRKRLRDIGDVRFEIEHLQEGGPSPAAVTPRPRRGLRLGVLLGLLAAATGGALLTRLLAPAGSEATAPLHLSITLPPSQQLNTSESPLIVFSPDGRSLVVPVVENGNAMLVERRLDERSVRPIEGTEGGSAPFFSPDGKWLGFIAGGKLKKVAVEGGRPFVLADQEGTSGAAWGSDGHIVFARSYSDGLFGIPADGGSPERLTTPDRAQGELGHWWPQILPGGRTVLFTAFRTPLDTSRVEAVSLDTGQVRQVVDGGFFGRYVPSGHLLYVKGDRLFAVPFDPRKAAVVGPEKSVLDDVYAAQTDGSSPLDVSSDGTLAYVPGSVADAPRELVQVTRDGRWRPAIPETRRYRGVSVSPDGRFLATSIQGESQDIWTYSLERQTLSRLTTGPRTEFDPFWSRDGGTVFFVLDRPPFEIHRIAFGTSAEGEPLWKEKAELDTVLCGLSADGHLAVYTVTDPGTRSDLWVRPVDGSEPARAFRNTPYRERYGTFSPDGRWMAYESDETGRPEVYVEAFPGPGERYQISAEGGTEPLWGRGSGEIFYSHGDEMRVVSARTGPRIELGKARTLFTLAGRAAGNNARSYDVSPDGRLVFMVRVPDADAPRRIDVLTHWLDHLAREVPR
jgi:serine/threonine protein kinase/Tol biopolymer transport system component